MPLGAAARRHHVPIRLFRGDEPSDVLHRPDDAQHAQLSMADPKYLSDGVAPPLVEGLLERDSVLLLRLQGREAVQRRRRRLADAACRA